MNNELLSEGVGLLLRAEWSCCAISCRPCNIELGIGEGLIRIPLPMQLSKDKARSPCGTPLAARVPNSLSGTLSSLSIDCNAHCQHSMHHRNFSTKPFHRGALCGKLSPRAVRKEPCWNRGAICGSGMTRGNCCSGCADCPWHQLGVCTCRQMTEGTMQ
jgi:hypothetical protein